MPRPSELLKRALADPRGVAEFGRWLDSLLKIDPATQTILNIPSPITGTYLDAHYLKLDASNAPLTGPLSTSGERRSVTLKSGDYTLTAADEVVVFTATATATLPAATGTGQTYRICNQGSGTVTVDASGGETIKGTLTQSIYAGYDLIVTDYQSGSWA